MPSLGMSDIWPYEDGEEALREDQEQNFMTVEEGEEREEAQRCWYVGRKSGDYLPI